MQRNKENNRMEKTIDLFKKIRNTKGTFHAKMGTIKNRNDMNLTKAEVIKKGWQKYTEELHKNILMTQITMMVSSLTKSQASWSAVKWALGSITTNKASGGDEIPAELFKILRQCSESAALNMPENLEDSAVVTGLEKVSFHSNP